jgi:hypothetical protein
MAESRRIANGLPLTPIRRMPIMRTMIRVSYHLSEQQRMALLRLSEKTGLSMAELVRRAVDAMLESRPMGDENERKRTNAWQRLAN